MTDPTETIGFRVRLPADLHATVAATAKEAGMSMNTWLVRQIAASVGPSTPATTGRRSSATASYLAELAFTLSGGDVDAQAQRLTEQMVNMTELAGGAAVTYRLVRTVPVPRP